MHPHLFDHLQYRQEKHHLSWHILKRNVNEEVKNWTIYRIFLTTFIGAAANIIFNFLLVKIMGAMGAAVSALISYLLIWLVRFIDSRRIIKLDINFGRDIISYLILGTQCVVMALNSRYSFTISLSLFCLLVVYNYKHINGILCMLSSKIKARKAG